MPKGSKSNTAGDARSAKTGRYVTPAYAKTHPSTTVVERDKPKPGKKK